MSYRVSAAMIAAGSVTTFASRTIRPSSSTTQMLVSWTETSNPAKHLMTAAALLDQGSSLKSSESPCEPVSAGLPEYP
jgi:hypothetical protein